MQQVTVHAAKTNLSELIDAALPGEEVVIAPPGKKTITDFGLRPSAADRTFRYRRPRSSAAAARQA